MNMQIAWGLAPNKSRPWIRISLCLSGSDLAKVSLAAGRFESSAAPDIIDAASSTPNLCTYGPTGGQLETGISGLMATLILQVLGE